MSEFCLKQSSCTHKSPKNCATCAMRQLNEKGKQQCLKM